MYAFYEWSHYLKGVSIPTEVLTDHQNLTYFWKPQNLNQQQAWWVMDLQDFNFVIKYWLGKANSKADILSRWAGHERGEKDNQGVILLGDNLFVWLHDNDQALEDLLEKITKVNKQQWEDMVKGNIKIHRKLQHLSNSETRLTSKSSSSPPKWNTRRTLASSLHRHDGSMGDSTCAGFKLVTQH